MLSIVAEPELVRDWWRCRWRRTWSWREVASAGSRLSSPATITPQPRPVDVAAPLSRVIRIRPGAGTVDSTKSGYWSSSIPTATFAILDPIVDAGIDCLDPIDPQAGLDIGQVKATSPTGRPKGNVDCARHDDLRHPEPGGHRNQRGASRRAAGGGRTSSSSNSIHSSVMPDDLAMLQDA